MGDFLEKMIGDGDPRKGRKCTSMVVTGEDHPALDTALEVVMFYAMNRPNGEGGGVREVGEKCSILMPGVEVMMVNQKTGEKNKALVGDYLITIERVE
jgi:hypothetical protein